MEREKRRRGLFSALFEDDPWEEPQPERRRREPPEEDWEAPPEREEAPHPRRDEWEDSRPLPAEREDAPLLRQEEPRPDGEKRPGKGENPDFAGDFEGEAPPPRRVLIQGESPYGSGLPGRRFAEEEGEEREPKKRLLDPEAQTPIEDGRTVVMVLQTILCCILLTVALVARQSGPERFAAFGGGLKELLEGDGKSLLDQLEGTPAEEFLARLLPEKKGEEPQPAPEEPEEPAQEPEEPLDFDWEEAGQLLEEPTGGVAAVMSRAALWIGGLEMPVAGALTSPYGDRIHPITEKRGFHSGVDLAAAEGTAVTAAQDGRVTETGSDETYGEYVVLTHGRVSTKYAHCSETLVSPGDRVRQGETIALVGNTGLSTGPHLHFEVWLEGTPVNPAWALADLAGAAVLA